jgi:hypothetical protein
MRMQSRTLSRRAYGEGHRHPCRAGDRRTGVDGCLGIFKADDRQELARINDIARWERDIALLDGQRLQVLEARHALLHVALRESDRLHRLVRQ